MIRTRYLISDTNVAVDGPHGQASMNLQPHAYSFEELLKCSDIPLSAPVTSFPEEKENNERWGL